MRASTEEGVILPEGNPSWEKKSVLLLAHSKQHRPTPCWREGPSGQQFNFSYQESSQRQSLKSHSSSHLAEGASSSIPSSLDFSYISLLNLPEPCPPVLQVNRDSPENPSQKNLELLGISSSWNTSPTLTQCPRTADPDIIASPACR